MPPKRKAAESPQTVRKARRLKGVDGRTVTDASIRKMAYQAGSPRVADTVYAEVREVIKKLLIAVLRHCVVVAQSYKKSTLNEEMLKMAFEKLGIRPLNATNEVPSTCKFITKAGAKRVKKALGSKMEQAVPTSRKPRKVPRKVAAVKKINNAQKQSDCFFIPHIRFAKVVRDVLRQIEEEQKNFGDTEHRVTKGFLISLHLTVEASIVRVLEDSEAEAVHAKRVGIQPKDMAIVKKVYDSGKRVPDWTQ
jgi:histone H3/H4